MSAKVVSHLGFCAQCQSASLSDYYRCKLCWEEEVPVRYELCVSCAMLYGREAHRHLRGDGHRFQFLHHIRSCNGCARTIEGDFLNCVACNRYTDSFDLCTTCSAKSWNLQSHTKVKGPNHVFRLVEWAPVIPMKEAEVVFEATNYSWSCDSCKTSIRGEVYRCIDCAGGGQGDYDLCDSCVDSGHLALHVKERHHHFHFFSSIPVPRDVTAGRESPELEL